MSSLRRRRPCSPSASSPLDVDDLLSEILLRLPPQPSSLPRASFVCKRWRILVSDPRFRRRFRIHHRRNPPLLGFFVKEVSTLSFVPTMEPPNRVPSGRLSLQFDHGQIFKPLGCRHGLALIFDKMRQQFLVWEPVTGDQQRLAVPPGFGPETSLLNGEVLRPAGDVHFQVVIVGMAKDDIHPGQRVLAWVYSSETGLWGDLISAPILLQPADYFFQIYSVWTGVSSTTSSVLVGDSLYFQLPCCSTSILEFDLEKQILDVIQVPVDFLGDCSCFTVIRTDGGAIGFLFVSDFTAQLWERNTDCDGIASWLLGRTIDLAKLLSLKKVQDHPRILGFAEENNMLFLWTASGLFTVQLQSLQFKKVSGFNIAPSCYPIESVYTTETDIGGEHDGAQFLHNA